MNVSALALHASSSSNFLKRNTLLIALMAGFASPAFALDWDIKNLGILPGAVSSSGTTLNDQGQVAGDMFYGTFTDEVGRVIPIQYSFLSGPNGGPLKLLDHDVFANQGYHANEVNNAGQVIGSAVQGSSTNFGWVTGPNGQGLQQVELFQPGIAINNSGTAVFKQIFGGATISTAGGTPQFINEVDRFAADFPKSINDAGEVALTEFYGENSNQSTGAVWSEEAGLQPIFFQGADTILFDINNSGQVLGQVANDPFRLLVLNPVDGAFNIIDLPGTGHLGDNLLQFETSGLPRFNDAGQIVGQYLLDGTTFSFLASATTGEVINLSTEQDLIAAGWSNIMVSDINNLGQISGTGTINGNSRAFLLTPVPEPETYAMMLAGISLLGFMRKRKTA